MRKYLRTLLKDLTAAALILTFAYAVLVYVKIDDYILKNIIKPAADSYGIDSTSIRFSYSFPLKMKAEGINIGKESLVREITIYLSPTVFMKRGNFSIIQLRIKDGIIHWADLRAFIADISSGGPRGDGTPLNIYSVRLEDVYVNFGNGRFVKITDSSIALNSDAVRKQISVREIRGVFSGEDIKLTNSTVAFRDDVAYFNVMGDVSAGKILIKGELGSHDSEILVETDYIPMSFLNSDISGFFGIRGKFRGKPSAPGFKGNLSTTDVKYAGLDLNDGTYQVSYGNKQLNVSDISLKAGGGELFGNLSIGSGDMFRVSGMLEFRDIDANLIWSDLGIDTDLNGNITFSGEGAAVGGLDGNFSMKGLNGKIGDDTIRNGDIDFVKEGDLIRISRFYADVGEGFISIKGDYYKKYYNFEVDMEGIDINKIRPIKTLEGTVKLKGLANRDATGDSFSGYVGFRDLSYDGRYTLDSLEAFISLGETLNADVFYQGFHVDGRLVSEKGKSDIYFKPDGFFISRRTIFYFNPREYMTLDLNAKMDRGSWIFESSRNTIRTEEYPEISFGFSELSADGKTVDLRGAYIDSPRSGLNGDLSFSDGERIKMSLRGGVELKEINDIFGLLPDLNGRMDIDANMAISDKKFSSGRIKINAGVVTADISGFEEIVFDSFLFDASLSDDVLDFQRLMFSVGGTENELDGYIKHVPDNDFEVLVSGEIKRMYSSFLVNFATDGVSVTQGTFSGPARFHYDGKMHVDADISLYDTQLIVFGLGDLVVDGLHGDAVIKNNKIRINSFAGVSGDDGKFRISGGIKDFIYDSELSLKISFSDADVSGIWFFSGRAGGEVALTGKGESVLMEGRVDVENGYVDAEFSDIFDNPYAEKEITGMNMNIRIVAKNDVWRNNGNANLELSTDFYYKRVRSNGDVYFSGDIETVKGTVDFLNVPFRITTGRLTFANSPGTMPRITLVGESDVFYKEKLTITLKISGYVDNPDVLLISDDPTLGNEDLVSLLTFNRTPDDFSGSDAVSEKMGEFATDYLQKTLLCSIHSRRLVDTFSVRGNLLYSDNPYLDVEVGKYLNPNLYITYKDEFIRGETRRFDFIYYFNRNLSVETGAMEDSGDYKYNIGLKFKFRY